MRVYNIENRTLLARFLSTRPDRAKARLAHRGQFGQINAVIGWLQELQKLARDEYGKEQSKIQIRHENFMHEMRQQHQETLAWLRRIFEKLTGET